MCELIPCDTKSGRFNALRSLDVKRSLTGIWRRWILACAAVAHQFNQAAGQTGGQSLNLFGYGGQQQVMLIDNANASQVASTAGGVNTNCGGASCSSTGTSYISTTKSGWDFVRICTCNTFQLRDGDSRIQLRRQTHEPHPRMPS